MIVILARKTVSSDVIVGSTKDRNVFASVVLARSSLTRRTEDSDALTTCVGSVASYAFSTHFETGIEVRTLRGNVNTGKTIYVLSRQTGDHFSDASTISIELEEGSRTINTFSILRIEVSTASRHIEAD